MKGRRHWPGMRILVFAFLYLPIVTLIVYSFNGAGVGGFPPRNLTLNWYRMLFADDAHLGLGAEQLRGRAGRRGDCIGAWEFPRRSRSIALIFPAKRFFVAWCCCR